MNLTPEQADWVRARRAAGDAVIGLVVEGDRERHFWTFPNPPGYIPPADWVALTGACETCGGEGDGRERWHDELGRYVVQCEHCIDGRKRETLTVACHAMPTYPCECWTSKGSTSFVVATVEVWPVRNGSPSCPTERHLCMQRGRLTWTWRNVDADRDDAWYAVPVPFALDHTPTPGVDFVVLLSDVVAA